MNYNKSLLKINHLSKFGIKLGLDRIKKILNYLGNPQDKLKIIHVAGTNGKGSVCNMLSSILRESGYKVGMFSSPCIIDIREYIQINNNIISKKKFLRTFKLVYNYLKLLNNNEIITQFEFLTAMAFQYFLEEKCDVIILETGLGGKYDATNVIKSPILSIITSISLDHTKILGDTMENIAIQKAGIIKKNSTTILYPNVDHKVKPIFSYIAKTKNNHLICSDFNIVKKLYSEIYSGIVFEYKNDIFSTQCIGDHQLNNIVTVLTAVEFLQQYFDIPINSLKLGLKKVKLSARLQIVSKHPLIILDGSHNPDSVKQLSLFIKNYLKNKYIIAIFSMLKDKDIESSLNYISPYLDEIIVTTVNNTRAFKLMEIFKIVKKYHNNVFGYENIRGALSLANLHIKSHINSVIIIFGSFYLSKEYLITKHKIKL